MKLSAYVTTLLLLAVPARAGSLLPVHIDGADTAEVWVAECPLTIPSDDRAACVVADAAADIDAGRFPLEIVLGGVYDDARLHGPRP